VKIIRVKSGNAYSSFQASERDAVHQFEVVCSTIIGEVWLTSSCGRVEQYRKLYEMIEEINA